MKISEVIKELQDIQETIGDIEVREAQDGEYEFEIKIIDDEVFIG